MVSTLDRHARNGQSCTQGLVTCLAELHRIRYTIEQSSTPFDNPSVSKSMFTGWMNDQPVGCLRKMTWQHVYHLAALFSYDTLSGVGWGSIGHHSAHHTTTMCQAAEQALPALLLLLHATHS